MADNARIDSFSKIEGGNGVYIGEYVHVASFSHINVGGGLLLMEEGTCASSGVKIITGSNVPGKDRSCSSIAPTSLIGRSFVWVQKNAILFAGSIVLPGSVIGEGAVVAAGAVVTESVPAGEIWAGVPARYKGRV